jgi:spore coat polysaccharide biosynthesis predicted glycosyltransferase SpsG
MILIDKLPKKKVVIHVCQADGKGTYPTRRAEMIARELKDIEVIFLCGNQSPPAPTDFQTVQIVTDSTLLRTLSEIKPDLLLRDSGSTSQEEVEKVREIVPSIIHFDDFGEGGNFADLVIQTLYSDSNDKIPNHYVEGIENFIADEKMASFKNIGLRKKELCPLPPLVI